MEDHVWKKPVAVDTTHDADVFKLKRQVLAGAVVLKDKHAAVRLPVLLDTALGCNARYGGERNPQHTTEPKCLLAHDPPSILEDDFLSLLRPRTRSRLALDSAAQDLSARYSVWSDSKYPRAAGVYGVI